MSPSDDDDDDRTIIRPPSQRAASAPLGHTLPLGTHLRDYEITGLIGEGGFGIVYLAWDHSLQRKVAIKEYMPAAMASRVAGSSAIVVKSERHLDTFKAGLESFINEARLLARFDHPALVKVLRFWEANGTAYMVMPHYQGRTLAALLKMADEFRPRRAARALAPLLDAVDGAARRAVLPSRHRAREHHPHRNRRRCCSTSARRAACSATRPGADRRAEAELRADRAVLRRRLACPRPVDRHLRAGRVVYNAIMRKPPPSAVARLMDDRLQPISVEAKGRYGDGFLRAIDAALAVRPQDRPQNEAQFRALLDIDLPAPPPSPAMSGYGALSHEPFPATQDGGYSTVPGTLTPELATQVQARVAEPAMPPPADVAPPPAVMAPTGRPAPTRQAPAPSRVPQAAAAAAPAPTGPSPASRTLLLGAAALLVVSGLAFGVYWTLQSRDDDAAKPAAPAASALATPASAAAPAVVPPAAGPASAVAKPPPVLSEAASAPVAPPASAIAAPPAPVVVEPPRPVVVEPPKPLAVEPAAPASSPRREPAVAASAPPRPRREPTRVEPARAEPPPAEPRSPPSYSPAYPSAKGTRCSDILQKGSLEALTAEEAAYLKRECR